MPLAHSPTSLEASPHWLHSAQEVPTVVTRALQALAELAEESTWIGDKSPVIR